MVRYNGLATDIFPYGTSRMWKIEWTPRFAKQHRKLEKKHRQEVEAADNNLDDYFVSLNQGVKPMQLVKHGFVHNEQNGVHAIDQSPLGKGFKALRLYVYPDTKTSILHAITMGDKDKQSRDVNECCLYVGDLKKTAASLSPQEDE